MKLRLSRLWPLGLFLAAALVAVCLLWPALPEALVLQGPDGYPDLSRPSFARRAAWWLAKGPSCLNHDELLRILLPSPLSHEWSYVLSSALLATAVGAYLRAVRLPVAACFAGGLAMAFSCYHFTLVNAGHRGYLTMMPYAAALFALVETAARRPRPAAFALMGVCAVCGLSAQPDVMALLSLFAAAYAVFRVAHLARAEGARNYFRARRAGFGLGVAAMLAAFALFGWGTVRSVFTDVLGAREAQMERALGAAAGEDGAPSADPAAKAEADWLFATNWSLPPEDVAEFVAPDARGRDSIPRGQIGRPGALAHQYWGRLGQMSGGAGNYRQHGLYLGALGVGFALFALIGAIVDLALRRRKDPAADDGGPAPGEEAPPAPGLVLFWWGAALVALLLAMGRYAPLYRLFYALPMADKIRAPVKFVHVLELCVSVLFALGLARLAAFRGERRDRLAARIAAGALCALGGVLLVASSRSDGAAQGAAAAFAPLFGATPARMTQVLGPDLRSLADLWESAFLHGAAMLALAIGGIAAVLAVRRAALRAALPWAFAAVAAIDAAWVDSGYLHVDDVSDRYGANPLASAMSERDRTPDGWSYSYLHTSSLGVVPPLAMRPEEPSILSLFGAVEQAGFFRADPASGEDSRLPALQASRGDVARLWAYWGVRGLLADGEGAQRLLAQGRRPAALLSLSRDMHFVTNDTPRFGLFAAPPAPPPVAVHHGWVRCDGGESAALTNFFARGFDPWRELVLEGEVADAPEGVVPAADAGRWTTSPFATSGMLGVAEAEAKTPGVMLLRENRIRQFPSVRATVNGAPAPVLRANGAFLAVPVPAGRVEVRVEPDVPWGRLWRAAFGWAAALALLAWCVGRTQKGNRFA